MADEKGTLPPGWDMKFDSRTGKFYYINHYTKTTTWEDPRDRYQQIGKAGVKEKENTKQEPELGLQVANQQVASMRRELESEQDFRNPRSSSPVGGRANTPQMGYAHASLGRLQLDTEHFDSPLPSQRSTLRRDSHILAEISELETNLANQETNKIEVAESESNIVTNIMPLDLETNKKEEVSDNMIELLAEMNALKDWADEQLEEDEDYEEEEEVDEIINQLAGEFAMKDMFLQFEIHEPNNEVTEVEQQHFNDEHFDLYDGNEIVANDDDEDFMEKFQNIRYLKSVFPTVEEYLLLDVLANSENNVQKTADKLSKMGYVRRETPAAPRLHAKRKEEERLAEKRTPLPKPPPIKTEKEKDDLRRKMKDRYEKKFNIPERILFMALESVLFDEDQANNLIQSMIEDDLKRQKAKEAEKARERAERKKSPKPMRKVVEAERPKPSSPKRVPRPLSTSQDKRGFTKHSVRINEESEITDGPSQNSGTKSIAKGPNPSLRKGPNDDLLLTDYVTWNGPNTSLKKGPNASAAKGPNPANRQNFNNKTVAIGPNPANRKGPQGLAKGSVYSSFKPDLQSRSN